MITTEQSPITTAVRVILEHMEQGSEEWLEARVGCITMSNAHKLLMKGRGKEESLTKLQYIIDVASEIVSGKPAEQIKVWAMQRGIILEPYARDAYEIKTGNEMMEIGLGYINQERRISCSPDGLLPDRGIEIKCQGAKAHMRTIIDDANPQGFNAQMQGGMWIFDKETWDYVSFCPEFKAMPLYIKTIHRDEEMIKRIRDESFEAVYKVDQFVAQMNLNPVNAEIDAVCKEAIVTIDILQGVEQEIE